MSDPPLLVALLVGAARARALQFSLPPQPPSRPYGSAPLPRDVLKECVFAVIKSAAVGSPETKVLTQVVRGIVALLCDNPAVLVVGTWLIAQQEACWAIAVLRC